MSSHQAGSGPKDTAESAAASSPHAAAPAEVRPAPPEDLPRKLTGARLFSLMTRGPQFREQRLFHEIVPYSADLVLKALCTAIAESEELGVYRPVRLFADEAPTRDPSSESVKLAARWIAAVLAARMNRQGAAQQVAADLDALMRVGMVLTDDADGWTLPLDFAELIQPKRPRTPRPRAATVRQPDGAGAPPPSGVSAAKLQANRDNGRKGGKPPSKQAELKMPIPGGLQSQPAAEPNSGAGGFPEEPKSVELGSAGAEVGFPVGSAIASASSPDDSASSSGSRGLPSHLAAAAEVESENILNTGTAAAAKKVRKKPGAREPATAKSDADALAGTEPNLTHAEPNSVGVGFREEPNSAPKAPADPHLLAIEVAEILGIDGTRGTAGAEMVAEWLELPLTRESILEVARQRKAGNQARLDRGDKRAKPIGAIDYLDGAMREEAGLRARRHASAAAAEVAAGPPSLPAGLRQPWMDDVHCFHFATALSLASKGEVKALSSCLMRLHRSYPRVLEALLAHKPELRAPVEEAVRRR